MTRSSLLRAGSGVVVGSVLSAGLLTAGLLTAAPAANATDPTLGQSLAAVTSGASAHRHLQALQRIADANGGTRAVGTPGYTASVTYVVTTLKAAGFQVSTPTFTYPVITELANSFAVDGDPVETVPMEFTPSTPVGGLTAPVVPVPEDATPGCEIADYAAVDVTDAIALVRRGSCTFAQKAQVAADAGAAAVVIANNTEGPLNGTLGGFGTPIPAAGISQADGDALFAAGGGDGVLDIEIDYAEARARNVVAQTSTGRTDNVVMLGAHLDSVPEGPGINDNGSGSAGLLEVASKLGSAPQVTNAVRFAWWGAEELGLVGSNAYVDSLTFDQQLDIALYLNFDMIGSPNPAYFVYDGDDSDQTGAGPGPVGSGAIDNLLSGYLARKGVATQGTDFDGRSDYGGFIAVGIPSSGIFTGAEGIKTRGQANRWGGTAGVAYDPCYHQACDTLLNINRLAFDRNVDAIAFATGYYALSTRDVNGTAGRSPQAAKAAAAQARPVLDGRAAA